MSRSALCLRSRGERCHSVNDVLHNFSQIASHGMF